MKKHKFKIELRDVNQKPKKLRKKMITPGNLFGPQRDSQAIKFDKKKFEELYYQIGESGIAYLQVEDKEVPAMIEEVQRDPVSDLPLHVSFKAIDLTEKIRADIPIRFEGEFEVPEAVLVRVRDEIEVEALPTDLPEEFVVDLDQLEEIGQAITLEELDFDPDKVELIVGEEGITAPIVLVQEMEEEEEEPEEIETEIIGEEEEELVEGEEGIEVEPTAGEEEPTVQDGQE
jgi:large subunit ribosomal protein L25